MMTEAIPDLLWIDNLVRARQLLHRQACIQVDANPLIGLIGKLTTVERLFRLGIQKIQVVRLAELRKTIVRDATTHFRLLIFRDFQCVNRGNYSIKRVEQMSTTARHALCVPLAIEDREFDHAMRTCFHASSLRSKIDGDVVYI